MSYLALKGLWQKRYSAAITERKGGIQPQRKSAQVNLVDHSSNRKTQVRLEKCSLNRYIWVVVIIIIIIIDVLYKAQARKSIKCAKATVNS